MANAKKTGIRAIRKGAHLTNKVLVKGTHFTSRVEDKATRIITGKDFSIKLDESISIEQALFNGIPYNLSPLNPALPAVGRGGTVTMLIPSLDNRSFFGGTATALIVAGKLAVKLGKPLRIVETLSPGGKSGLGDFMLQNNIHLQDEVELIDVSARTYDRYGYIDLHPDDIFLASAWWDAKLLNRLPLKRKFIYLIQDFEPIFYSNSDEYVLAESTYNTANFIPLCNTKMMYDFMCSHKYDYIKNNALWFEPAVSMKDHGVTTQKEGKKRIFLYGRPSVARNLFYNGLTALNDVFNDGKLHPNDWEIFMAGQDKLPDIRLSTGLTVKNLGKMSMDDYTKFVSSTDVAVSLMMAPHPNYPTLEFASVGAAVVTTKYETKQDLSKYSKNIFMTDLNVESIAEGIVKAAKLSYEDRMKNLETTSIATSWDEMLDGPLEQITKRLKTKAS